MCDLRDADETRGRPPWLDPEVGWELPGLGEGGDAQVGELVTLAADAANGPMLFHAGVGSDRAVVVAAVVLSALGVADAELPFFPTRAEVLADLRRRYGSVERYLTGGVGLAPGDLAALHDRLVGP